jgi:signal transduction histidine kinase
MFEQVSQEGFEVHPRNVISKSSAAPDLKQKPAGMAPAAEADRSRTVSRSRSFAELSSESDGGLLPYMSDHGLELLFWTKLPGKIVGCTLRMDMLRARAADVIPGILSDVRILTVLDESGTPIVAPEIYSPTPEPDWRRPFAAREISPILPRWEVGAWLTNPSALADRARLAQVAAWVQVAILFSVMLAGSMIVIRMTSYEMRVASQKTTFVANVSHELKTPLTSIRLFAELLLSGRQENEERRREYLRTMMSEADRLSHLVDNVLSFSRRGAEKYNFQTISLTEVARDTISQLEPHLTKLGYTISFSEDSPLFIKGNREAMKQVIMNLLSNAEKYSGESREISIESREQGDFAVVKIADRGIGVDPLLTEKIFQEFVRGDDSLSSPRSGTGLGLSIARDIARRHGGDVLYEPRTGGGSVFSLILSLLKSE